MDMPTEVVIRLRVKCANVNLGDATAKIGISVPRVDLNPVVADEMLCGKRLQVLLVRGAGGDPNQQEFWDDLRFKVDATADVKAYSVNPKNVGFGLTFNLDEIGDQPLSKFAKTDACLVIVEVKNIPKDEKGHDDQTDEDPAQQNFLGEEGMDANDEG